MAGRLVGASRIISRLGDTAAPTGPDAPGRNTQSPAECSCCVLWNVRQTAVAPPLPGPAHEFEKETRHPNARALSQAHLARTVARRRPHGLSVLPAVSRRRF